MALNIAVPLSGVGDLLDGFGFLSPISTISIDCRDSLNFLLSPTSESSGFSSLDSDEVKKLEKVDIEAVPKNDDADDIKIMVNNRNVLDLTANIFDESYNLNYSKLPAADNIQFFLENRSQYHRLGANGHVHEYAMIKCNCCDFKYPVNGFNSTDKTVENCNLMMNTRNTQMFSCNPNNIPNNIMNIPTRGMNSIRSAFNNLTKTSPQNNKYKQQPTNQNNNAFIQSAAFAQSKYNSKHGGRYTNTNITNYNYKHVYAYFKNM